MRRFSNLKSRLSLMVLIGLVPFVLLTLYSDIRHRHSIEGQIRNELSSISFLAKDSLNNFFNTTRLLLLTISQTAEVQKGSYSSISVFFRNLHKHYPEYVNIGMVDLKGNIVCSSLPMTIPVNSSDLFWFQQALRTRDFSIGEYQVGRIAGVPVMVLSQPVFDQEGRMKAVLYLSIKLDWLKQLVTDIKLPKGYALVVTDRKGTILSRHPEPENWTGKLITDTPMMNAMLSQKGGIKELAGLDGIKRIQSFSTAGYGANYIYVAVGISKEAAFKDSNQILLIDLLLIIVLGVAGLVSTKIFSNTFILRPVNALTSASENLLKSNFSARTGYAGRTDELGRLAGIFDNMADAIEKEFSIRKKTEEVLQQAHDGLEQHVADRTEELRQVNAKLQNDISERKRAEDELISANIKLESLWNVTSLSNADTKTVSDHILESITRMTQSEYGFYGFINNDESVMTIHSWSGEAMKACSLVDKPQHFPIDEAGVWAMAVRSREPLILNDYRIAHEGKKGLPAGHVELTNLMVVPFFTQGRITAVAAVANRRTAYIQDDVIQITTFLNSIKAVVDSKRAEEMVRESQRRLTDIIEFLPDATLAIDNDKRIIIWNRAIEEMTGIPAQEMIGKGDYAYTIPFYGEARPQLMDLVFENREEIANWYPQITREGDNLMAEVFCNALYDNKGAWVYAKSTPLRDQDGNVKGAIEIIRDITEQKRYENALMDYQRNLADVINFLPDATFVIDKNGIVTAWNNAMVSMTGIKAEEMIGKGNYEYAIPFYGERRPIIIDLIISENEEFLRKSYDAINYQEAVLSGEVYVPETFGGKGAYLWGNASRLYNASGEVIGAIQSIRNITDRKQAEAERRALEERLQRAEKMESLGTLAGGVAHDLNNVLGIVVGYAEMLMDELDESNPMRDDLEKILEGGNRSAAIVQDLLTLARRGVQTKKTVNLNATIMDCQKLPEFEKVLSYNPQVKMKINLESDLLNIMGSPVHLGKTLINLVSNAVEAMHDGGVLTISTTNQYLDMPLQGYDNIREGDYVVLTVSDTGEGILERDIKRIFEPFYTKKIMGRSGTGLGLAVVWGTVKDHNGYINAYSTEGKGTTFTLYFPVTREDMESEQISVSMSEYMGNGETILIVDDINRQCELAYRMLTKLNYSVSTVASGEEAIEYLRKKKADLIVLDMIMDPGIDGLETYENILKLNPVQKAVIVSGFSESDRVKEAQRIGAGAYVSKPYVLERLGMAVRKELDRK